MRKIYTLTAMALLSWMGAVAQVVKTVDVGEGQTLESLLGDDKYGIDSLVITGQLQTADFKTLRNCCEHEKLTGINMKACTVADGILPEGAFCVAQEMGRLIPAPRHVTLPETLKKIGARAFMMTALMEINIPEGVESVGDYAFNNCLDVKGALVVPEGVTTVGEESFSDCAFVTSLSLPSTRESMGYAAFKGLTNATELTLADGIKNIGTAAFAFMEQLKTLELPASVETVGSYAFQGCTGVREVYVGQETPPVLMGSDSPFADFASKATLYVPVGAKESYATAKYWREFKTILETDKYPSSMGGTTTGGSRPAQYYTMDGRRVGGLQQGVTLVRLTDGTVKKVLRK